MGSNEIIELIIFEVVKLTKDYLSWGKYTKKKNLNNLIKLPIL